jgi:ABC-type oligopeptide transport system substrate-binding subunit
MTFQRGGGKGHKTNCALPWLLKEVTCTYYYGFVNNKPPMDDVRVRKAFAMAVNKQSLVRDVT